MAKHARFHMKAHVHIRPALFGVCCDMAVSSATLSALPSIDDGADAFRKFAVLSGAVWCSVEWCVVVVLVLVVVCGLVVVWWWCCGALLINHSMFCVMEPLTHFETPHIMCASR
jgi:hypothetical protein